MVRRWQDMGLPATYIITTKGVTSVLVEGDVCTEGTVWTSVYRKVDGRREVVALVPSVDVDRIAEKPSPNW